MEGAVLNQLIKDQKNNSKDLDMEWVYLILMSKEDGLTDGDILTFIKNHRQSE